MAIFSGIAPPKITVLIGSQFLYVGVAVAFLVILTLKTKRTELR